MNRIAKMVLHRHKCPICNYPMDMCQCLYSGSAHPDRREEREVVLQHLYLLSKLQLRHVISLEKCRQTSYGDDKRTEILKKLEADKDEG